MNTTILHPAGLSAAAWSPFGWMPVDDTDALDGVRTLEFVWGDPHVNVIGHARSEVDWTEQGAVVARMYRHDTHTQTLMPLNSAGILAVAPGAVSFDDPADLATIRAFVVQPLESLVLDRGTWHWGPFPLGEEPIRMFNVQGRRYLEDNACAELSGLGPPVMVTLP